MAEFLTTRGISHLLEEIIKGANEHLVIISPYLQFDDRIKELLEDKEIEIEVIYGKKDLKAKEKTWLESMEHIRLSFRKSLHAKCYLNEDFALLTSMNLSEFSQANNDEMGILVSFDEEPDLYLEIMNESIRLLERSEEGKTVAKRAKIGPQQAIAKPEKGYCIRCKTDIGADPRKPYCYTDWKRGNNKRKENHCHTCGKEHGTSMKKPLCFACYRKYKDVLEFAAG